MECPKCGRQIPPNYMVCPWCKEKNPEMADRQVPGEEEPEGT
jgi:uncharacterized OB-fold protein